MFDQIHNFQIQIDEMEHLIREGEDKARKERVQRLEEEVNYLAQIVQLEEHLKSMSILLNTGRCVFLS